MEIATVNKLHLVYEKYPLLTTQEIKNLIVEDKWLQIIRTNIDSEINRISQRLTNRIVELANRYEKPLPAVEQQVQELQNKVAAHLQKMGMVWN